MEDAKGMFDIITGSKYGSPGCDILQFHSDKPIESNTLNQESLDTWFKFPFCCSPFSDKVMKAVEQGSKESEGTQG
jgi:hypothetical protein